MFNIYRVQEEQTLKDEDADRIEGIRRHQHAEEVRQQIREKEKERIKATNAFFEEGIKLDQEAKARYVCFFSNSRVTMTTCIDIDQNLHPRPNHTTPKKFENEVFFPKMYQMLKQRRGPRRGPRQV